MKRSVIRRTVLAAACGALALATSRLCAGQIALPEVQVGVPVVGVPGDVGSALPAAGVRLDARKLRLRQLLRHNRGQLDTDSRGEVIVRNEILVYGPSTGALQRAAAAGFTQLRRRGLDGLDVEVVVLQSPAGLSARRALQRLRALDPEGVYDFNHIYLESGRAPAVAAAAPSSAATRNEPGPGNRVGLIDSGLAPTHPALMVADIRTHGCNGKPHPAAHGTAVASLLLGGLGSTPGAGARSQIFAADVYCGAATGGAVDAVIDALAWMAREQVPVVNVSLVGPPNALLERVVARVVSRGQTLVAAVGNDGPAAPPLYPAAYADVVAVTAVDRRHRVLLEAGRGPFVDFAAPGADLAAAALSGGVAPVRGTSFAAAIVAGHLARQIVRLDRTVSDAAVRALAADAVDLGARGHDPVYGHGLVGERSGLW